MICEAVGLTLATQTRGRSSVNSLKKLIRSLFMASTWSESAKREITFEKFVNCCSRLSITVRKLIVCILTAQIRHAAANPRSAGRSAKGQGSDQRAETVTARRARRKHVRATRTPAHARQVRRIDQLKPRARSIPSGPLIA